MLILPDLNSLPDTSNINTFADVINTSNLSPYIQYAYDSCLLHGRNTIDGEPVGGTERLFDPKSGITVAETAKILYNMTHSQENSLQIGNKNP